MRNLPIIFSAAMVKANRAGDKHETRRLNGLELVNTLHVDQPLGAWPLSEFRGFEGIKSHWRLQNDVDSWTDHYHTFAFGEPGDVLYVRENYRFDSKFDLNVPSWLSQQSWAADVQVWYEADGEAPANYGKQRPSIHLPKRFSRDILLVKDRSVERLQDITEEGARNEGVLCLQSPGVQDEHPLGLWYNYGEGERPALLSARESFRTLWTSIHGDGLYTWDYNPFVYVIKYSPYNFPF